MTAALIVGAGPVGLAAALSLKFAGLDVEVVDARPHGSGADDPRALALAHGSRLILERLCAWRRIAATPIEVIEVSQADGFGRARIEAAEHGIEALGHVVRLGRLGAALLESTEAAGIPVHFNSPASVVRPIEGGMRVALPGGERDVALLVRAEGTPGDTARRRDYGQTAIVTEAWPAAPRDARAWERFTREGPLALLPLEDGFSVVWCMSPERARDMLACDDAAFLAALGEATRFAPYRWRRTGPRAGFPLALMRRPDDASPREVSLGNAAQTLHPVAGQGFNLGLRDAFELAAALVSGIDGPAIAAWRARRRADRDATVRATDAYVSVFSNDFAPLRIARGLGLVAVDLIPPLRRAVARRMMFGLR
jgi:2-octaprenyl-6-methoxyphenol hydroxylase